MADAGARRSTVGRCGLYVDRAIFELLLFSVLLSMIGLSAVGFLFLREPLPTVPQTMKGRVETSLEH